MELLGATLTELQEYCKELDQPAFRGKQIAGWLYNKSVYNIDEMTNLSKPFRDLLRETSTLSRSDVITESLSSDGTFKLLLELSDGNRIETVLLPYTDRQTVCVSTQVGCAAGCAFCASTALGFVRDLTAGEIIDQVLTAQSRGKRVTNVVYMGVGEPLFNYDNVVKSVRLLMDEMGIAGRHITISTVGVTPRIVRLAREKLQLTLAISLHAAHDHLRRELMPIAAKYPLKDMLAACQIYANTTGRRVTAEYVLLAEVNDSIADAKELARLLKGMLCNVNLIPYNPVEGLSYKRPSQARVAAFRKTLELYDIPVTQRFERGDAVMAACGQLRRSQMDEGESE